MPLYICIYKRIFFQFYTVYILYYNINITVDNSVKFHDVYSFKPHTNGKHMKPKSAYLYCTFNASDYENEIRILKNIHTCIIIFLRKIFIITFIWFASAVFIFNLLGFSFNLGMNNKKHDSLCTPPETTLETL